MTTSDAKGTKERRSLIEGLSTASPVDRAVENQFVYAQKPVASGATKAIEKPDESPTAAKMHAPSVARVPFTTRLRGDFAAALKRASLERQLSGTTPNTLQDILEEALEPWLQANGYLTRPPQ